MSAKGAVASRRPLRGRGLLRLHEEIDGIVDRFADHCHAEGQRHAVHVAEARTDGGEAGEYAACDRHQARSSVRTER